ncbi:MAG: Nucleolar protein 16 [Alectoria sarmentosa]|nr:MAG: Nucleolar protein 16 [Alectoria sarmentosa]
MARPLQKKKNRSSLHRVRQKPKSKHVNVKSNPIVAANWDQSLTLSQNYRRLGLSSKLSAYTGGTEAKTKPTTLESQRKDSLSIPTSHKLSELGTTEVKVTRDPKTGAIVSVQHEKAERENPLDDPLNELSDSEDEDQDARSSNGRGIVAELEEQARHSRRKRPRMQSQREREWIERLVEKWGEDWGGMVRDRKLNPQQQTEGDLKRRIAVWKGGRRRRQLGGQGWEMEAG